jgi:hypothetical protein
MSGGLGNKQSGRSQRTARRHRVLMGGLIVSPCGSDVLECTVLDSSEAGAKVRVLGERLIPKEFRFVHLKYQNVHTARLIWRRGQLIGLSFSDSQALDEPLPLELTPVYRPFVRAKLRQIGALLRKGHSLEDSLSLTGTNRLSYDRWREVVAPASRQRKPS